MKKIDPKKPWEKLETKGTKINPEIKARWIAALIEADKNETPRGIQHFKVGVPDPIDKEKVNNNYSVSGILCDVYLKEKGLEWKLGKWGRSACLGQTYVLPKEVLEWAEMSRGDPIFENENAGNYSRATLSVIASNPQTTFTEFATMIENNL